MSEIMDHGELDIANCNMSEIELVGRTKSLIQMYKSCANFNLSSSYLDLSMTEQVLSSKEEEALRDLVNILKEKCIFKGVWVFID